MRSGRPTAILAVKNGLGLGHVRRATLVAQSLQQRGHMDPVIISQAGSTALYAGSSLRVLNLPRLSRVSHVLVEDACLAILDEVAARVAPSVIVEDTYPDPRLREIDSLRGVPRMLVTRRLDASSLEQMVEDRSFAGLDRIAYCQTVEEFRSEGHSSSIERVMRLSGIARFVGPLWRSASPEERAQARSRYARDSHRLVVVTLGGGGDKYLDAFARRMIEGVITAGVTIGGLGRSWCMVIVAGPYSRGSIPTFNEIPGITLVEFEPELPALLAAADVVVLKPGTNALLEALDGDARLILVPDRSYREGLPEYAERLARAYGHSVSVPEAGPLTVALYDALNSDTSPRLRPGSSADAVAGMVEQVASEPRDTAPGVPVGVVRLEEDLSRDRLSALGLPADRIETIARRPSDREQKGSVHYLDDVPAANIDPHAVLERPDSIFIAPRGPQGRKIALWLRHRGLDPRLHLALVDTFRVRDGCRDRLISWMLRTLADNPRACLLFVVDPKCTSWECEVAPIPATLRSIGTSWTSLPTLAQRLAQEFITGDERTS